MKRLTFLDNACGFAILLVVLGHVVQFMFRPDSFDQNVIFRFIYSFHMPFFMVLSGLFQSPYYATTHGGGGLNTLWNKCLRLVIPFIAWAVVSGILKHNISIGIVFFKPDLGLWFLWVLFLIFIVFHCTIAAARLFKANPIVALAVVCILIRITVSILPFDAFGIGLIKTYFPYFCLGSVLGRYKTEFPKFRYRYHLTAVLCSAFIISASVWYRLPSKVPIEAGHLTVILNNSDIYRYFVGGTGSLTFLMLFAIIGDKWTHVFLSYCGRKSLGIYAPHQLLIITSLVYTPNEILHLYTTPFGLLLSFSLVLVITLILVKLLSLNRYLKNIFLGEK